MITDDSWVRLDSSSKTFEETSLLVTTHWTKPVPSLTIANHIFPTDLRL